MSASCDRPLRKFRPGTTYRPGYPEETEGIPIVIAYLDICTVWRVLCA